MSRPRWVKLKFAGWISFRVICAVLQPVGFVTRILDYYAGWKD